MVWNTTSAGARGQGFPISYFPFGADSLNEPIQEVRKGIAMITPVKMLIINPGSTSAKVRYFEDEANVYTESIFHDAPVLLRYRFHETCQDTVPQAIIAFLESTDFEDAIRNAISFGGDSDTPAAITGSIAEAAYGIPDWIKDKAYSYLDEPLKDVLRRWKQYIAPARRANQI